MKAIWNSVTLAESDETIVVEGNHYFPPESVNTAYLTSSETHTSCPWKGRADYYSIVVDGATNPDAAWFYPEPKAAAENITGRIAFWRGVQVVEG